MIKKCIICGKNYQTYSNKGSGARSKSKRAKNTKTCSRECSSKLRLELKRYRTHLRGYKNSLKKAREL